ncbi:MAG TPA: hypothetical protein VG711_12805 [Phycisphaerales bacterium]|nr:hypothetical protein [Phycisphaerales bacterium]
MANRPTILMHGGDLASLVCLAMESEPADFVLWHVIGSDAGAAMRREVVERHAGRFGVREVCAVPTAVMETLPKMARKEDLETQHLVAAALLARELRSIRLVYPRQIGLEFPTVAQAIDAAQRVAKAVNEMGNAPWQGAPIARTLKSFSDVSTDKPSSQGLEIDLPVADLTDSRLVELAAEIVDDLDFWPCVSAGPGTCGECQGCRRWLPALAAIDAGITPMTTVFSV